jgi:hypothetical protein
MAADEARRPWDCDALAILCENDHLLAFYLADWRFDLRRVSGHAFAACHKCKPPTYMLVVFAKVDGLANVTVYPLHEQSYREWSNGDEPTIGTSELLYRVKDPEGRSHNPDWRPATVRRKP